MRLAIVSDTHMTRAQGGAGGCMPRGARALPDSCVERCRGADAILHCGDFVRLEIVAQFEGCGPPLYGVYGNVDEPAVRDRLPADRVVELGGKRIGMLHDAGPARGRLERLRRAYPDADAVLFGHSHLPAHERGPDGFQIFNPGSPTERRRAPARTMGVATIADGGLTFELVAVG